MLIRRAIHETKQVMAATLLSALSYGRLYSKYHALFTLYLSPSLSHGCDTSHLPIGPGCAKMKTYLYPYM